MPATIPVRSCPAAEKSLPYREGPKCHNKDTSNIATHGNTRISALVFAVHHDDLHIIKHLL